MLLLNGVFCWFNKLNDFWQTALVAGGIFAAGLSAGLFVKGWQDVPKKLDVTVERVDTLKDVQLAQQKKIDSIMLPTIMKIDTALTEIKQDVGELGYQVQIVKCYQENLTGNDLRKCVETAGTIFSNPNNTP